MGVAQTLRDFEAVHARHPEIDQGNLGLERARGLEPHGTRVRYRHSVLLLTERGGQSGCGIYVVVDDAHALRPAVAIPRRLLRSFHGNWNFRRGQCDDEFAAGARAVALGCDRTAMQLDEAADQRETDPEAALGAIERCVSLHEEIEYPRQRIGGNPIAIVANVDPDFVTAVVHHGAYRDVAALRGELDGIVHQIADDLLEPQRVDEHHHRLRGQLDHDLLLRGLDRRAQRVHGAREQLAELDALPGELNLPVRTELRHPNRHHPVIFAVRAAKAELVLERLRPPDGCVVDRGVSVPVLRMQEIRPGVTQQFVGFDAEKFDVRLVDVFHAFEAAYPNERRGAVHQGAEARFAAAQVRLHFLPFRDLFRDAHRGCRLACRVDDAEATQLHPDRLAVLADIALFAPDGGDESRAHPLEVLAMPADVVGVSDVLGAEREQRVAGPPRQFTEAVVDALEAALQIGLEDADRRAVVNDSQALRTHPQRFRVLFDRVDIDEGDDGALDVVFGGAVGADAQRVPPSRSVLHIALERLHALQHSGQNDVEIGHVHVELDVGQRPADVGGDQVEHRLRHRREAPDPQIRAEHDDRHLHAGEQVHQVVVAPPQLGIAVLQLFVDGRQLLVARLHLLLGRFNLFVDALQLLVGRLDLLVGRLQLFVRRVLLLDDRLEVVLRGRQLLLERLHLIFRPPSGARARGARRACGGGLVEEHEETAAFRGDSLDRHDFDVHAPRLALSLDPHVVLPNRSAFSLRSHDGRADRREQTLTQHLHEVQRRLAGKWGQIGPGIAVELQDLQVLGHQDAGRRVARQQDAISLPLGSFAATRIDGGRGRCRPGTVQQRPV